jgi:predicted RNA-binding Zn-ribbon protein involved in translation (DUF1610 family)
MAKIVLHKSSAIDFQCPHCQQAMTVERDMQGTVFDCPACGKPISCHRAGSTSGANENADDESRTLSAIARSSAETAQAVKEIRNLIAGILIMALVFLVVVIVVTIASH